MEVGDLECLADRSRVYHFSNYWWEKIFIQNLSFSFAPDLCIPICQIDFGRHIFP